MVGPSCHGSMGTPRRPGIVSLFGWMTITTGRSWQELKDICHPEASDMGSWGRVGYPKMASKMAKFHGENHGQPLNHWDFAASLLRPRAGGHFQHMGSWNHFLDSHHAGRLSPLDPKWNHFPGTCHIYWRKKRNGMPNFKGSYRGFSEPPEKPGAALPNRLGKGSQ